MISSFRLYAYCISSHLDYDETTSPGFVMKWYPSVCLLVLGDSSQFHLTRISRFSIWGQTLSGLHMASWSNSVGAMVLEFSRACLWDHNTLHYSLSTNFLQDIGKVHGKQGAADMAVSHSNSIVGYLYQKSHDTLLIQGLLPRNSFCGHQIVHPGVLLVFLQKYCYPSFL